jgi:hypothetical protein
VDGLHILGMLFVVRCNKGKMKASISHVKTERLMTLWYVTVPKFLHINDQNLEGQTVSARAICCALRKLTQKKNQFYNGSILGRFMEVCTI